MRAVVSPALLQQDHSIGVSEAGHRLQYEEQGMSGEPAILDMDADVELHIASIVPYCGVSSGGPGGCHVAQSVVLHCGTGGSRAQHGEAGGT